MWISNNTLRTIACCGYGLTLPLHADELTLIDGDSHLTGSVRSINEAGLVELSSPLSPEPLLLKGESLAKVVFSNPGTTPAPPPMLVELANGDLLPATIESLGEHNLTVTSPAAGRLEIQREHLTSMQLGMRRLKVLYSGPRNLNEWNDGKIKAKNWIFRDKALVAKGQATASMEIPLPQQFILRFTLKWQAQQTPNFQVCFADPLLEKGDPSDRYYLQFGGAGLEIKREASKGKRYNPILSLGNRVPKLYPDNELKVEIRVNRSNSRFELFLNGEPEGKFADLTSPTPDGSGITLICNAPNGSDQEIRDIEIIESDDLRVRHRSEERGDPKNDSLISREDDRWGGRLIDIRKMGDKTIFRFKSDFQNDPLEITGEDVSTVFFASKDTVEPDDKEYPFILHLRGEGSLRVSSCSFTEDTVSASHPLLGMLKLRRDCIISMEHTHSKPKTTPEP